ncbi:MAG: trimethylamine methyltransferase family protein [Deltaproteobacteria bacterium]|jgi:trimethylamine--corrinoid protein Co-methyltransferase|nr:trimethylamine methyltransferase family protein [Deltaproteobacteria bacterium]
MFYERIQKFSQSELSLIHEASMEILAKNGLVFADAETLDTFKSRGFAVEGKRVLFTERQILTALETAPDRFKFQARNPQKSLWIGGEDYALAPTYGPPFVVDAKGRQSAGTMADYEKAVKLAQTSEFVDFNAFKYLAPGDVPAETSYLDMVRAALVLSDKPLMGGTDGKTGSENTMKLMDLVFGKEFVDSNAVTMGLINPLSPLSYAHEMSGAIMAYARRRQPVIIHNMIMAGASGPIRLPGLMAIVNAEILGGMTLAQLVGPGTPVIYGSNSCPIFMKTGGAEISNPQSLWVCSAVNQLARYYRLPSRTGGAVTDAHIPDAQAMAESAMTLMVTVMAGTNLILHAFGQLGCFIGFSFEKWIMDEELCGYMRSLSRKFEISRESLDVAATIEVGSGGTFLTRPETAKLCRKAFYAHKLFNKHDEAGWRKEGALELVAKAQKIIERRLGDYQAPDLPPALVKDLDALVEALKASHH